MHSIAVVPGECREIAVNSVTASATGLDLVAHHDLGGAGDGMQVIRQADAVYVGHAGTSGTGTSILDATDPLRPELVTQWPAPPRSHTHKVQVADGLLLVNHEKFPYRETYADGFSAGLAVYTLADPLRPEQAGFWHSGGGASTASCGRAAGTRTCPPPPTGSATGSG